MKTLIVYYSRTETTKKIAQAIANEIECDIEEIVDMTNRDGNMGYLKSCVDAILKKDTTIKDIVYNPQDYDLIIIGTPVWASTVSNSVRMYIIQNAMNFKNVAFFCTEKSSGSEKTFKDMKLLCNKEPIDVIRFTTKEVNNESYSQQIKEFIDTIISYKKYKR